MPQEPPSRVEHRLSAILAADVAGYSRLMLCDEEATHAKLTALLADAVVWALLLPCHCSYSRARNNSRSFASSSMFSARITLPTMGGCGAVCIS